MNWDEARTETIRFLRGLLGSGYIAEYYADPADELIAILKQVEADGADATTQPPADEPKPSNVEVVESLEAYATILRGFADRLRG